jgi:putative SOS response-associated peptidase YedK
MPDPLGAGRGRVGRVHENGRMAGRFVVAHPSDELVSMFDIDKPAGNLPAPSWNVAPGDQIAVVIDAVNKDAATEDYDPENPQVLRRLESARWGLVPADATDPAVGGTLFTAEIEATAAHPAFGPALAAKRAAIPASGYYVWVKSPSGEASAQFVHSPDGETLLFAGLYSWWRNPAAAADAPNRWVLSATILTRPAGGALSGLAPRMPVFLEPGLLEDWLDPRTPAGDGLLEAVTDAALDLSGELELYEVSTAVASVKNNSEALIQPV